MKRLLQVFLSYAKEDVVTARKLYRELIKDTFINVWFDEKALVPGQNWKREVTKAIRTSDLFIALISHNSVSKRGIVQKELREAIDVVMELPQDKNFIIPVRLDNTIPSNEFLSNIHWFDMFKGWKQGIDQIKRAIYLDYYEDKDLAKDFTEVNLVHILTNIPKRIKFISRIERKYQLNYKSYSVNPIVLGNEDMLTQVFLNIIINAIDFGIPESVTKKIKVNIRIYENGHWIFVQVQNKGQPIYEDDIMYGRIFEPFFATSPSGMGLGLAVSKMLVEKHGGAIFTVSTPINNSSGKKAITIFTIALPRIVKHKKNSFNKL